MDKIIKKVLISQEEISQKVKETGQQISEDYKDKNPIILGILKGAFIFMADLLRCITVPCEVDFMCASSYGSGTVSSGKVTIKKDVSADVTGRDIIIVEDIMDSGITLSAVEKHLYELGAKSVSICVMLDKPERRSPGIDIKPDYTLFTIPNEFIVGYGLDYNEKHRNLPYVGILDENEINQ